MSRDYRRIDYREFRDDRRDRYRENDRSWGRNDYRDRYQKNAMPMKRRDTNREKHLSRSPRKPDKDLIDDNILSEISKLPEPSELWDNQMQDGHQNYQPPPSNYGQDGANYGGNYQPQYSGIYDDFPSVNAAPPAPDMSSWNQMSLPPPPSVVPTPVYNMEDQIKKEAAIETEMRHQKAALSKQREDYIKKAGILKKELDTLKDQRNELRGDSKRSPSPDTKRFLKENTKLQLEIQNKLKTINNVVDMLNGIIGEEAAEVPEIEETSERISKRKSRSPSGNKFNYVYYDPEMHWCRVCNEFPPTAKDYLNHLHSAAHHKMASSHMEAPWHSIVGMNEGFPNHTSAPTKRTPIKGLQFFVPSTAWYCKLCDQFIGDLHCASAHLKSVVHAKNFTNFVEQNPHWETDWMSDRQKAFEKSRASTTTEERYTSHTIAFNKDGFQMRRKSQSPERRRPKKKKKNKRKHASSSSDSESDSDSERKKKKEKKEKARIQEEKLSEWMSAVRDDDDRKLIDTIKNRMKMEEVTRRRGSTPVLRSPSRDRERRDNNSRDERERRDERDNRRDERDNRRDERDTRRETNAERKKPDIRKMPFIGKMPVYKNLSKTQKTEEQKKEELKKKDEDETKKRQEAMDAEIQKKVAEFKEKIARAQEERAAEQQMALPPTLPPSLPPTLPPPTLMAIPPPALVSIPPPAAPGTQPPQPNLPKDFQDALDIIFPSDVKKEHQQDMFAGVNMNMPPGGMPPFQMGMGMNPFPQPSILGEPPMMMGFNAMNPMFPRPQLYDHVPVATKNNNQNNNKRFNNTSQKKKEEEEKGQKNKEELDDLAMLGIDASDVGAGM